VRRAIRRRVKVDQSKHGLWRAVVSNLDSRGGNGHDWTMKDIMVADEPEDFALVITRAYESKNFGIGLGRWLRKKRASYSTDTANQALEFLFREEHLKV